MDLRLSLCGYALTLQLRRQWRLLAGVWSGGRTAWLQIGPVAVVVRATRWHGDQR